MAMGTHKGAPPERQSCFQPGTLRGWQSHRESAQAPPNRKSLKAGDLRALEEMDPPAKHTRSLGKGEGWACVALIPGVRVPHAPQIV